MSKLNNAQIKCIGCIAIYDYEEVDAEQNIWKGTPVFQAEADIEERTIFFSRKYDRVNSDVDRMLDEYVVKDESVIGVPFILIPKEKMLFLYQPPSTIIRVPTKVSRRMR